MRSPASDPAREATSDPAGIDIRNLSVKCGRCETYQTLVRFARREGWNVYIYECESALCDPNTSRTLLEVPVSLDIFARRDPDWHGGDRHTGGGHGSDGAAAQAEPESPLQQFEYDPFAEDS